MMIQLQYRIPNDGHVPTMAEVKKLRQLWMNNKPLPAGVQLKATVWDHDKEKPITQNEIKEICAQKKLFFGPAGVVREYADSKNAFIDIDARRIPESLRIDRLVLIARTLRIGFNQIGYIKTQNGWHVQIRLSRALKPAETVAFQAILGSDPKREMFNLARVLGGKAGRNRRWNLLFEYKVQ